MQKSRQCKYESLFGDILKSDDCPAEWAIRFANTLLTHFANKDYIKLIDNEKGFSQILETHLQLLYPGAQVFWAPGREKARREELERNASLGKSSQDDSFRGWLNKIIIRLNDDYHSGAFLHQLVMHTTIANANIFTVSPQPEGIQLISMAADCLPDKTINQSTPNWGEHDFLMEFKPSSLKVKLFNQYIQKLLPDWKEGTFTQNNNSIEEVRNYLEQWSSFTPSADVLLEGVWKNNQVDEKNRNIIVQESKRALPHMALMCLYMLNNHYSCASYFLSPTIQGRYDSSMVIYWGLTGLPERSFLYLLSMLLGLNASPVLQANMRQEVINAAFKNTGHTMRNRCDNVSRYFKSHEPMWHKDMRKEISEKGVIDRKLSQEEGDYNRAWIAAESLSETSLALQLWGYSSQKEFFLGLEDYKKDRFFDYTGTSLDIIHEIEQWRHLAIFRKTLLLPEKNEIKLFNVFVRLISENISKVILVPSVQDPKRKALCRLQTNVLCAIFYEILRNATQHGMAEKLREEDIRLNRAFVNLYYTKDMIDERDVLVFYNDADLTDPGRLDRWEPMATFVEIPDDLGKGPGLVAGVLRNLNLGDIWFQRLGDISGHPTYCVAVGLEGLEIHT